MGVIFQAQQDIAWRSPHVAAYHAFACCFQATTIDLSPNEQLILESTWSIAEAQKRKLLQLHTVDDRKSLHRSLVYHARRDSHFLPLGTALNQLSPASRSAHLCTHPIYYLTVREAHHRGANIATLSTLQLLCRQLVHQDYALECVPAEASMTSWCISAQKLPWWL